VAFASGPSAFGCAEADQAAAPNGFARSTRLRSRGLFIAAHRSLRRWMLSRKSGLLPNTRARMSAVAAVTLKRISLRGSIVGTRHDLDKVIALSVEGKVKAKITKAILGDINTIFAKLKVGNIEERMVLNLSMPLAARKQKVEGKLVSA
jgi:hypothetical protein